MKQGRQRDKDGDIYSVPGDIKYAEWKNKYVEDSISDNDRKLFNKYVTILGLNAAYY